MWLRCDSFEVIEELPGWRTFGPHGDAVADLITQAEQISQAQVDAIAAIDAGQEWQVRLAFLDRWRSRQPDGPHLLEPAGWGGLHINAAIECVAARTGQHLFGWDESPGDWPVLIDPTWLSAYRAAIAKMTAVSAPDLMSNREMQILSSRWDSVSHFHRDGAGHGQYGRAGVHVGRGSR